MKHRQPTRSSPAHKAATDIAARAMAAAYRWLVVRLSQSSAAKMCPRERARRGRRARQDAGAGRKEIEAGAKETDAKGARRLTILIIFDGGICEACRPSALGEKSASRVAVQFAAWTLSKNQSNWEAGCQGGRRNLALGFPLCAPSQPIEIVVWGPGLAEARIGGVITCEGSRHSRLGGEEVLPLGDDEALCKARY